MNEKGIAITFNNFKVWTKMYPWEEYDEIKSLLTEEEYENVYFSDEQYEHLEEQINKTGTALNAFFCPMGNDRTNTLLNRRPFF